MIRVGIIGMGFMGGVHFRNWQMQPNAEVVAVCDSNLQLETARGNIDMGSGSLKMEGVAIFHEVADMLAAEQLDAVSVALPSHLHRRVSIQCMQAGAHVLCEKPMALSLEDCDAMIAAAKKAGRQLMVAHCIRFWPEYAWVKKRVESREYGSVLAADFQRLTGAPGWDKDNWFSDPEKSGGIAMDLHIHDLDFIQHLLGVPGSVRSVHCGTRHVQTQLDYGAGRVISATASWMMPESFGFEMSFRVVFEKAAAVYAGSALKIYPSEGRPFTPDLEQGDGYQHEIEYFAGLADGKHANTMAAPEASRESVRMALETLK